VPFSAAEACEIRFGAINDFIIRRRAEFVRYRFPQRFWAVYDSSADLVFEEIGSLILRSAIFIRFSAGWCC
jgi:hypothetical protein